MFAFASDLQCKLSCACGVLLSHGDRRAEDWGPQENHQNCTEREWGGRGCYSTTPQQCPLGWSAVSQWGS